MPPIVRLEGVSKRFGAVVALDELSLEIARGSFFALLGPSGCGKTTLLRLLAGFDMPDAGRIFIDGEDMTRVPPHRRPVNMMFQSYALFPHMDVARNIGFGLVQEGVSKPQIAGRVSDMLGLVKLDGLGDRRPDQLSGGQKQRVALARALIKRPKLLLLDEPLAALDRRLREATQFELMRLQGQLGTTFVLVTHDQREAMVMAQRIAVMRLGQIEQIGAPAEIYDTPTSRYVAEFIGETNLIEGRMARPNAAMSTVTTAIGDIEILTRAARAEGAPVTIAIRPERLILNPVEPARDANMFVGEVVEEAYGGDVTFYRVRLPGGVVLHAARHNAGAGAGRLQRGDTVAVSIPPQAGIVLER